MSELAPLRLGFVPAQPPLVPLAPAGTALPYDEYALLEVGAGGFYTIHVVLRAY